MMRAALALTFVLALAACGGTKTVTVTQTVATTETVTTQSSQSAAAPCLASALTGSFAAVPGSAGAGNIVYRLRLTNQGDAECFVTGFPASVLLDQKGAQLPTNLTPDQPGTGTAVRVDLKPGDASTADVRFSPDVPGGTEQNDGPCEPKAYTLRLTIGDGSVDAPIVPPTPVCERGSLQSTNLTPDQPGTGTAVRVDLKPGDASTADVRFSPDVPGGTEQNTGQCEPKASTLRLTIGEGTVDAPIVPPTPVCERGTLQYRNLTAAS